MTGMEGWKRLTGDHLERIRKSREITLRGVERHTRDLGFPVSRAHIHDIESGRSWPRYHELHVLASTYDIHARELFDRLPGPPTDDVPKRWSFHETFVAAKDAYSQGHIGRAATFFDAAFARTGESVEQAKSAVNAGHCYALLELNDRALDRFQRALGRVDQREPGRVRIVARMARALAETGRLVEAEVYVAFLQQQLSQGLPDSVAAYVEEEYGLVLILLGDTKRGLSITKDAIKRYRARGDKASAARKMAFAAHHMLDDTKKALHLALEAESLARETSQIPCQLYTLARLAQTAASANDTEVALRALDQLTQKSHALGMEHYIARAQRLTVEIGIRLGVEIPPKNGSRS